MTIAGLYVIRLFLVLADLQAYISDPQHEAQRGAKNLQTAPYCIPLDTFQETLIKNNNQKQNTTL